MMLKIYCFVIGRQGVDVVQTTPFLITQPLTSFGKAAPASPWHWQQNGGRMPTRARSCLRIMAADRPAAKLSFDRACRVGA